MAHHILYIPGFGDHNSTTQLKILKKWNKFGVKTHFITINWADNEPFEAKLGRVLEQIDELNKPGNKISLVGVSAGGSMAINAYMTRKDKISGVVFICAKLRNPEGVNASYFRKNPAFRKSVFMAGANVDKLTESDKAKMMTIHSFFDGLIPLRDSQIPSVKNQTLPVLFHVPTIFFATTLFKRTTISFLKTRAE